MKCRASDGTMVDVYEKACLLRPCFQWGVDRGSYAQGRGYMTRRNEYVCMERHLRGCPQPLPEPMEASDDQG